MRVSPYYNDDIIKKVMKLTFLLYGIVCFSSAAYAKDISNLSILIENFESFTVGDTWPKVQDTQIIDNCGLESERNKCLRVKFVPTWQGSARLTKKFEIPPHDHYRLSYDIYFEPGFEFMMGGKLPGLSPTHAAAGCEKTAHDAWSARVMWLSVGAARNYYYGQNRSEACGDGEMTAPSVFKTGRWHHIDLNVKLNSKTGEYNGHIVLKVDGDIVADDRSLQLRSIYSEDTLINTFLFSTFFGGSSRAWAPSKNVYARFDNFTVTPLGVIPDSFENSMSIQPKQPEPPRLFLLDAFLKPSKFIYKQNFEEIQSGAFLDSQWKKNLDGTRWAAGFSQKRALIDTSRSRERAGQSLQVLYPKDVMNSRDSGMRWLFDAGGRFRALSLSYWIYIDEDFNFAHGGKLPGLTHSSEEKNNQWTALLSWVKSGFLRLETGSLAGYKQHRITYEGRIPRLNTGEWQFLEMYVVVNNEDTANGSIEVWLNRDKVGFLNRLNFAPKGNAGRINFVRFDTYMTNNNGAVLNDQDQQIWFDNLALARSPLE